jgi:hypothetical protein
MKACVISLPKRLLVSQAEMSCESEISMGAELHEDRWNLLAILRSFCSRHETGHINDNGGLYVAIFITSSLN